MLVATESIDGYQVAGLIAIRAGLLLIRLINGLYIVGILLLLRIVIINNKLG